MKTLTEFAAINLKTASEKKQELTAAGKTAEELPAALGEALKVEGDKLTYLLAALDAVGEKTKDLKRVVVSALNEGETAPSGAKLIGEKYFTVEYYTQMMRTAPREEEGGRDGKGRRDGKGGRGGRGGKPGERGGREGGGGGGRGPGGPGRGDGERRGPRAPMQAQGDGKPAALPKPLVKPASPKPADEAPKAE